MLAVEGDGGAIVTNTTNTTATSATAATSSSVTRELGKITLEGVLRRRVPGLLVLLCPLDALHSF